MPFLLTKWYLDCVSHAGDALVGYAAQLSSGVLRARYASLLRASPSSAPASLVRLRGATLPELHAGRVTWTAPALDLVGTWSHGAAPLHVELLDEPGALSWSCHLPRAQVELRHRGQRLAGDGYAESLTMRVPPWRLPIDELRWGRAHVGAHTLVWLDWRGPRPLRRVFLDGHERDGDVTDDAVRVPGLTVSLRKAATLRKGDVAKTALARLPALSRLLSRHRLHLVEEKWLSRAAAGHQHGWAIHEVVRWA